MSIFKKRAAYKNNLSSFSCKTIVYVQLTGLLHQKLYTSETFLWWWVKGQGGFCTGCASCLRSSDHIHLSSLGERTCESVWEVGESRANATLRKHWNPSVFTKSSKKMRKAVTHFLETGSITVLRYQSKLQDNAKRNEGLSCDFKTHFSDQVCLAVSIIWFKELFHWHCCNCPPWLDRAVPIPISSGAASDHLHLHLPLPERKAKIQECNFCKIN